jgi:hypothetical protein
MEARKLKPVNSSFEGVYYQKIKIGYKLMTVSGQTCKELKKFGFELEYQKDLSTFIGFSQSLPAIPGIEIRKVKKQVVPPGIAKIHKIEMLFEKLNKMERVFEKMMKEIEKVEDSLLKEVKENGLSLKPFAENDYQILSPMHKTRLHYQEAIKQRFHVGIAQALVQEFPVLKKCIKTKKQNYVDTKVLKRLLPDLPQSIIRKLVSFETQHSFQRIRLSKPGCGFCGGKLNLERFCKRCGIMAKD